MNTNAGGLTAATTWLSVPNICATLEVARATLYRWWALGSGPRRVKLPNGDIRVRADWLDDWMLGREDAAA